MAVTKGFLFTSVAIIVIAAIVILAATTDTLYPRAQAQADRSRSMQVHLQNLQRDLPSVVYIATFRGLIGMEEHISATGEYHADVNSAFASVFTNGTINGSYYPIMDDSTFNDFATRFADLARRQGMIANLTVENVSAYQVDPWYLTVNVSVQVYLADTSRTALFNRTEHVTTKVPIESIKDPLYTVGTQGRAPHIVTKSNVTRPFITAGNDTQRLQTLLNETFYIESTQAPSFLQRFSGNFTASPYGIESLVNIQELRAQDIDINTCTSTVDYLYFQGADTTPNYNIINMDANGIWLDAASLADFDATDKTAGVRPCP